VDRGEHVRLVDAGQSSLGHLEDGEERDDDLVHAAHVLEELVEAAVASSTEPFGEHRHAILDAHALGSDLERHLLVGALEHRLERIEQLEEADARQRRWPSCLRRLHATREDVATGDAAREQLLRRVLVLLVLEQTPDQLGARIDLLLGLGLFVRLRRIGRQEHLALDVGEGRRHHEVLARHVEIEVLHDSQVLEVPLDHERDREIEDVELVLLDEVQEEVERPLERRQPQLEVRVEGLDGRCLLRLPLGFALLPLALAFALRIELRRQRLRRELALGAGRVGAALDVAVVAA
jgi:hypothetical protein